VARIGEGRGVYRGLVGRIILSWTLGRWGSIGRTGFGWLRIGSNGGFCEHGNDPSGSIKQNIF
jgi:hypothetical protein